jgi:non-specific serine/threonine protein kinase
MSAFESHANLGRAAPLRRFGRFALGVLLGRSERSMVWQVTDTRDGAERVLLLPRHPPPTAAALAHALALAQHAARLRHPRLAPVLELGQHDGWPYQLVDGPAGRVLAAQLKRLPLAPREAATVTGHLCEALAYCHESGVVHGDVQLHMVLIDDQGRAQLMGLELAPAVGPVTAADARAAATATLAEADRLRQLRAIARQDVVAAGLVLYTVLSNQFPLDEPDLGNVLARLPPEGREAVRLPWSLPRPVPEALRAIVDRAADRQERRRYASARSLAHALDGWLKADADSALGPLALLVDRLSSVGVLPALPGGADRAARLALMERERTQDLAEVVMQDLALSFELLRQVNLAQSRAGQMASSGPVLTIRRAIALIGVDGVRRAALALRPWPGPLNEVDALELQRLVHRAQRAASLAQALRPPEWDSEVVALATLLQFLGPLLIQYHLPDDARQIRRLMEPQPPSEPGGKPQPGMTELAASFAVLGVDLDAVGAAVARHWGLDETVAQLMRRLPPGNTVYPPDSDDAFLRALGSLAREAVEAAAQPAAQTAGALQRVAQRYARALQITPDELRDALVYAKAASGGPLEPLRRPAAAPAADASRAANGR